MYETVRCEGLYPDTDLEYSHTAAGELKTNWHVGAGADTSRIRWAYSPGVSVGLVDGDLWIDVGRDNQGERTASAVWRDLRPAAWQVLPQGRREVPASFQRFADGSFGFDLAPYDDRYPLEIDPTLVFSTFLGGNRSEGPLQVAIGSDDAIYFAAHTTSSDFPMADALFAPGPGATRTNDVVVGRIAADGSRVEWSTLVGGTGREFVSALVLDAQDNLFVTGRTDSADLPTVAAHQSELHGEMDVFVIELDNTGQELRWSSYLGGSEDEEGKTVAVRGDGVVVVGGVTESRDFPVKQPTQAVLQGAADGFLAWFAADNRLHSSTFLGGSASDDIVRDICLDRNDVAYVVGGTSTGFPVHKGTLPGHGGFLCRASLVGVLDYCTLLGAGSIHDCTVDGRGRVIAVGQSIGTDMPTVKPLHSPHVGYPDASIMVVDGDRQTLLFSSPLGGREADWAVAVDVDESGDAYVLGETRSSDFPMVNPVHASRSGFYDAFVARVDVDAPELLGSTYFGGSDNESASSIAVVDVGVALAAGSTGSIDFPTTGGAADRVFGAPGEGFLTLLDFRSDPPPPTDTPDPSREASVCRLILHKVPPAAIAAAMADPSTVPGWERPCRSNLPPGPWNGKARTLSLRRLSVPYHDLYNPLIFACGCP